MKYSFLSRLPKIKYYPTWLNVSGKGCRKVWRVAVTFLNDKARPYVEPLAKELEAVMFLPMGVSKRGELEAVFDRIEREWGHLNILVHSIAFVPKDDLQGGLLNCSSSGLERFAKGDSLR